MHYHLSYHSPHKQLINIKFEIKNIQQENNIVLQIAAWRPGRYELQQYAKNIINFKIVDEKNNTIFWEKETRNSWRIEKTNCEKIIVTYSYYASQMDAGGAWLDENQLYINPVNCLMFLKELVNEPHIIEIQLPDNYKIATGLEINQNKLVAKNYLHLADSPIVASKYLQNHLFEVNAIPISIWILGDCKPDWNRIEIDFRGFISSQLSVFVDFPERDYHFLIEILPYAHYHGVEHRNSTMMTLGADVDFGNPEFYKRLLGLASHEFFHTWNICKIRPKEMQPYNLTKENYFSTGFVVEGITTYYGNLMLLKSGIWNFEEYAAEFNDSLNKHFSNPARHGTSLVQTSMDLWVDGYQKTHPNRKVSIYDKGAIVALILDLEIRRHTENRKSLNDAMLLLWQKFGKTSIGYSIDDYKNTIEQIAEITLDRYFEDCIYGSVPLERILAKSLDYIGLVINIHHPEDVLEQKFGLRLAKESDKYIVIALEAGSPAEKSLSLNDKIISVNGLASPSDWQKLYEKQMITISLIRAGKSMTKNLIADGGNYFPIYSLKQNDKMNNVQKENFDLWAGI